MSIDIERATLKKAAVSTLPLWAEQDQRLSLLLNDLPEETNQEPDQMAAGSSLTQLPLQGSSSISSTSSGVSEAGRGGTGSTSHSHRQLHGAKSRSTLNGLAISNNSTLRQGTLATAAATGIGLGHQQDWSVFATMSNVSTLSDLARKYPHNATSSSSLISPTSTLPAEPQSAQSPDANVISSLRRFPQKLDEIFKPRTTGHITATSPTGSAGSYPSAATATPTCTCTCPNHSPQQQQSSSPFFKRGSRLGLSLSKRRNQKESMELMRGYPTGQCVSTEPPESTNWDEKDAELPLTQGYGVTKNTAFNLDAIKGFLNSPLFSNFLKSLTVMAAVSLFAIALDAIIILVKASNNNPAMTLSNDNAALIITVILSLLTIAYSCFTIFLESRRPPEGLDTSNSKPLIVIFSEIIASIVWAQVLSITIYIYIWTYGCTEAGAEQLARLWKQDMPDHHLTDRLCRRQGAMVGLELLLVMLIIFNFYTHLAQNFKFIRAVS
ncbi:hypothetical protein BGZ88_002328 [Linnemannia elongata]|nr:hypothetical protein BGZ88_002328 [Linnemannia elongata]KAG0071573.1 hypothetical protein BGZ89_010176 [Linnemannia elongata]KAK5816206.1 hypothetical protein F5H01DRAFT_413615 [Linnemannia elongata]